MKLSTPTVRELPAAASATALETVAGCPGLPRLHVLSDVHLETGDYEIPRELDFDILVAAGDIGPVELSVPWLAKVGKPVVYVLGNHEHWGTDFGEALKLARRLARGTQVHVLERDEVTLQGVRFLGATLWTDYGDWNKDLVWQALKYSRDYSEISAKTWWSRKANQGRANKRAAAVGYRHSTEPKFSPAIAYEEHLKTMEWLRQSLGGSRDTPTVVVSHHAPTRLSLLAAGVDETYLNPKHWGSRERAVGKVAAYASPVLDEKLEHERFGIALWAHGHLHHAIDIVAGGTRVVANPRGYASKPLTDADIKFSGFFGYALTVEDVARSQAAHAADPYAGDGHNFDPLGVVTFGDGLRRPLQAALAPQLEKLDALIAENEELLPFVRKGYDVPTRSVERVFHENCERYTALLQAIQRNEGRAVDATSRSHSLARFRAPNKQPSQPWGRISGVATRKSYADELVLMRQWRDWVALLPRAAELGLRQWVRLGVRGLECLRSAGIAAEVYPLGFENLRRLTYRDLTFRVEDESRHKEAEALLERLYNRDRTPRDVLFSVRNGALWAGSEGSQQSLAQLRALARLLAASAR